MLGIVCALSDEFNAMVSQLKDAKHETYHSFDIYIGQIGITKVGIILSGVGKVNSSIGACVLIEHFSAKLILSIGLAGAVNSELMIGDLVIGERLMYYDSYLSNLPTEGIKVEIVSHMAVPFTIGENILRCVTGLLRDELPPLPDMVKKRSNNLYPKVWMGLMASGDMPVDSKLSADKIYNTFNALSVDMESASICHVSHRYNTMALPIRIISDYANEHSIVYLLRYGRDLCNYLAEIVKKMVESGLYQSIITF